jgi:hypothetical protein
MHDNEVVATQSVIDLARSLGAVVEEPVLLRSTNNLVMWLRPSVIVAKVSVDYASSATELAIALALADAGAPIVPPVHDFGTDVYRVRDRYVTFWQYEPQDAATEATAKSVAQTLGLLHAALATLGDLVQARTHLDQMAGAIRDLDIPTFAPDLFPLDRSCLRRALTQGLDALGKGQTVGHVVHGSPHRFNILVVAGSPRFIDFETVQRGPLEWDLAHLEREVADAYPGDLNIENLASCRLAISALTATWCWNALTRGPDMRGHAEHHLEVVRSSLG